jgi:hypothetical protein
MRDRDHAYAQDGWAATLSGFDAGGALESISPARHHAAVC